MPDSAVIAEQYGKIMITTGAASDGTYQKGYTLVYQAYTPASMYLTGAVDLLASLDANAKKIAIIHENDKFSSDVAVALDAYAKSKGCEILINEGYDSGTTDFAPIINKIPAEADAIMGGGHFADGQQLAKALFAIPAVKGVEFGTGFKAAEMKGSQNNDLFKIEDGRIVTASNHAGGILGGISDGMPLVLRVAVKPTPSIARKQRSVNLDTMRETNITIKGRHDVCLAPRAAVIVESMMAVTLCDFALRAGLIERIIK